MHSEQLLQLAVKYATRARKRQLANRLTGMAEPLFKEREAEETALAESVQSSFMSNSFHNFDEDMDMFAATPPVLQIEGDFSLMKEEGKICKNTFFSV